MSSTDGAFSNRPNQVLHLDVSIAETPDGSTANWALYLVRRSGTGSFSGSPSGAWSVNIGGNITSGPVPAYNLQGGNTVVGIASGAFAVPNGVVLGSSAIANGVATLGNASLETADAVGPGQPGLPALTSNVPTRINASWGVPANGGADITSYRVIYGGTPSLGDASYFDTGNSAASVAINGLIPGRTYYVAVHAQNALGFGARSAVASIRVGIGGRIWDGTQERPLVTAKVWDGTQERDLAVAGIWSGSQELQSI